MPSRITVYPNPVRDVIKLRLEPYSTKWMVTIFDANGKQVYSSCVTSSAQINITVSNLAAGYCFMLIGSGNKLYDATFIKQ